MALPVVRDNLRHASVQTTERYLHVEPDRQHAQTQRIGHRFQLRGQCGGVLLRHGAEGVGCAFLLDDLHA